MRRPLIVALASLATGAIAVDARAQDNWNQWNEPAVSALGHGATNAGVGVDWAHVPGSHSVRLALDVEHLLRDRWGLVLRAALPFDGEWVAPLLLGARFHVIARSPIDPFVGAGGGFAWMKPAGLGTRFDPMASGEAGIAIHYFGLFTFEASARYDVARYAGAAGALDRSGVVVGGRTGVYF